MSIINQGCILSLLVRVSFFGFKKKSIKVLIESLTCDKCLITECMEKRKLCTTQTYIGRHWICLDLNDTFHLK